MELVNNRYRVMGVQETGEEICVADNLTPTQANEVADKAIEDYPEWRSVFIECMDEDYDFDPAYDDFDPSFPIG